MRSWRTEVGGGGGTHTYTNTEGKQQVETSVGCVEIQKERATHAP